MIRLLSYVTPRLCLASLEATLRPGKRSPAYDSQARVSRRDGL